jgi:hypothetical protein
VGYFKRNHVKPLDNPPLNQELKPGPRKQEAGAQTAKLLYSIEAMQRFKAVTSECITYLSITAQFDFKWRPKFLSFRPSSV